MFIYDVVLIWVNVFTYDVVLIWFCVSQLRPPQPAVYLFVLDVSHNAVQAGYLQHFCDCLLDNLDK